MRGSTAWAAGACAMLAAGTAWAGSAPPSQPPEEIEVELDPDRPPEPPCPQPAPAPAPAPKPAAKPAPPEIEPTKPLREGLYLRIAAGPSYFSSIFSMLAKRTEDALYAAIFTGVATNLEGRIGVGIIPGVAFGARGGALVLHRLSLDGETIDAPPAVLGAVGWFADMYFAKSGFHFSVSPAFTWLHLPDPSGSFGDYAELKGMSINGALGYEGALSDSWGLGVQVRVDGGFLDHGNVKTDDVTSHLNWIAPGIQLTATYF